MSSAAKPFIAKVDYFGLAVSGVPLGVKTDNPNKSAQLAEGHNSAGGVVAHHVYGETFAPSNTYELTGLWEADAADVKLGNVTSATPPGESAAKKMMLTSLQINTAAGQDPTITASGVEVEAGAATKHYFPIPGFSLDTIAHAQILFGAFTVGGADCELQTANYNFNCSSVLGTLVGAPVASDVTDGYVEVSVEINQYGSAVPTITPKTEDGWFVSSALNCDNPETDYPTWSATLRLNLTHTVAT